MPLLFNQNAQTVHTRSISHNIIAVYSIAGFELGSRYSFSGCDDHCVYNLSPCRHPRPLVNILHLHTTATLALQQGLQSVLQSRKQYVFSYNCTWLFVVLYLGTYIDYCNAGLVTQACIYVVKGSVATSDSLAQFWRDFGAILARFWGDLGPEGGSSFRQNSNLVCMLPLFENSVSIHHSTDTRRRRNEIFSMSNCLFPSDAVSRFFFCQVFCLLMDN